MPQLLAFIIYLLLAPLSGVSASLINVKDVYARPIHYLNFTPQIAVPDGYFRLLIPRQETILDQTLPPVSIEDQPGYTFAPPLSIAPGEPGCTAPAGYYCFEFPYHGAGPSGTPLVISLEAPAITGVPFILRHHNQLGVLVDYTVGDLSQPQGVQVTAQVSGPLASPTAQPLVTFPFLPATISRLTTREDIAVLYPYLIAIAILLLLIILLSRRHNILILDQATGKPLEHFIIYHSRPEVRRGRLLLTRQPPISYQASSHHHGRLYIRRLGRFSTLTIRVKDLTFILSLSASRRHYVIAL